MHTKKEGKDEKDGSLGEEQEQAQEIYGNWEEEYRYRGRKSLKVKAGESVISELSSGHRAYLMTFMLHRATSYCLLPHIMY